MTAVSRQYDCHVFIIAATSPANQRHSPEMLRAGESTGPPRTTGTKDAPQSHGDESRIRLCLVGLRLVALADSNAAAAVAASPGW